MSPFPLPIAFTSQAFKKNADGTPEDANAVEHVIAKARLMGARSIGVQINSGYPGEVNADEVKALRDAGFFVVAWGVANGDTAHVLATLAPNGWLPQVESTAQLDALVAALGAGAGSTLPTAVVTTYGGLDTTAAVQRLKDAGIGRAFVECYAADGGPHGNVPTMLAQGTVYGFAAADLAPVVGTYRSETAATYDLSDVGRAFGVYLIEPMTDDALRSFGAVPDVQPTPEPQVTNDAPARNAQIAGIAETWLANFGPAPRSRLANIAAIAGSDDDHWNAVRDDVVAALNGDVDKLRAELDDTKAALDAANAKIAAAKTALT